MTSKFENRSMCGTGVGQECPDQYNHRMGEELGRTFNALRSELVWVNVKWVEYIELFGTNPERVNLLNAAAPNFFGIIQEVLFEHIILQVARLTDPARSLGKENLSINVLPDLLPPNLKDSILRLVKEADSKADFCRDRRNRYIVHNDLSLALKEKHAEPLSEASRQQLCAALQSIGEVLNAVLESYGFNRMWFEQTTPALGDARSLLSVLNSSAKSSRG